MRRRVRATGSGWIGAVVVAVGLVVAGVLVAACAGSSPPGATGGAPVGPSAPSVGPTGDPSVGPTGDPSVGPTGDPSVSRTGDPNAAGRAVAAATVSGPASPGPSGDGGAAGGGAAGGSAGICANETLADSMARAVDAGASVVLATGAFTGTVQLGDGEIGVPYSQVALTDVSTLAGPELSPPLSAWVPGDLAGTGAAATTGETSSLWAPGGRLIAVVDPVSGGSGLPGPVIRVAPVVGNDVVMGWVGCWSTQGVPARDFTGAVELFDDRGRHPTEMNLTAVGLDDFRAALPPR